eukprot:9130987-Pyramimonas_sp.AAC.1
MLAMRKLAFKEGSSCIRTRLLLMTREMKFWRLQFMESNWSASRRSGGRFVGCYDVGRVGTSCGRPVFGGSGEGGCRQ